MDSIADVLGRYNPQEPDEALLIKRYITDEFNAPASVVVRDTAITVTVASASLANMLRLRIHALRKAAGTKKRVIFRIG